MKTKKGFTLIELLVVIAIIALLMSILMPALSKVKKQAMAVACRARMNQWGAICSMYTSENDGMFHMRNTGQPSGWGHQMWTSVYKPFYKDPTMRCCAAAENGAIHTGPYATYGGPGYPAGAHGSWNPQATDAIPKGEDKYWFGSLGMSRYIEDARGPGYDNSPDFWRKADVKGGDKVPVLFDCLYVLAWGSSKGDPPEYNGQFGIGDMKDITVDRHDGTSNYLFLDWSVRKVGLKESWTLQWSKSFNTCDVYTLCNYKGSKKQCHDFWNSKAYWMKNMPEY